MNRRLPRLLLLATVLLLAPLAAVAQTFPLDLEVGYRWLEVTGNDNMYRSQVNEREGFLLRSLSFQSADLFADSGLVDSIRLDASDVGIGPGTFARLEARKNGAYKLVASYRRNDVFSALPTFANPLLSSGVTPGQHTIDRKREMLDIELEMLPGHWITPIFGYSWNKYSGPGQTTYHVGWDEYKVNSSLSDSEQEFRVGLGFNAGIVTGDVTQGWRKYEGRETLTLVPGAGAGNNPGTILGKAENLTRYTRTAVNDTNAPITSANVAANFGALRVIGAYVKTEVEADGTDTEDVAGELVSYDIMKFFKSLTGSVAYNAKSPYERVTGRAELTLVKGIDVTAGFSRRDREVDGRSVMAGLYGDTSTFTGFPTGSVQTELVADTTAIRRDDIFDLGLSVRPAGPISVRIAWSQVNQSFEFSDDPWDPNQFGQGGDYNRTIYAFDGTLNFAYGPINLDAGIRHESADTTVVRTDFVDRQRIRFRAAFKPAEWIRATWSINDADWSNDRPGYQYDGGSTQQTGTLELIPSKTVNFFLSGSSYKFDSSIPIRIPSTWAVSTSTQSESGKSIEGGVRLAFSPISLEGAFGSYDNDGSNPVRLDRTRLNANFAFTESISLIGEWLRDDYKEYNYHASDFTGNRYGFFVRFHQ